MKIKKHTITHAIKYIFLSLLLALPFIAMLPSTFYYAFNQNAQDNTANEVNITYQYQTNEVNNINEIQIGNIYKCSYKITEWLTFYSREEQKEMFFNVYNININGYVENDDFFTESNKMDYNLSITYNIVYIYVFSGINNNTYMYNGLLINYDNDEIEITFDIIATQDLINLFEYLILQEIGDENYLISNLTKSSYLGNQTYEIVEHDLNNQNAFYYASSQVFEKPLFNWVKNSIFVVPIMGMLGIFGISEMNFISSLLVYWVNILSIYAILNIILLVVEKLGSFGKRKNE